MAKVTHIFFDTEDNSPELQKKGISGFEKKVTQIAAITSNGEKFHNRGNVPEFMRWLKSHGECYAWALNCAYDLGNLKGDELDELSMTLVGGRLIKATWKKTEFRDVFNIWRNSVKELGKAFGLKKMEMNVHSKRYVFRDCEIIKKAMEFAMDLCARRGVERMPCTLGSLSIKLWQANGGSNWFDDSEFSHRALFGGRVELFRREVKGLCQHLDINSLYPYCMTKAFPTECGDLKRELDGYGIAAVKIKIPEMFICPLPARMDDGRVVFPYGTLEGVWTLHEIRNAMEQGATVEKVYASVGSEEGEFYYKGFIEEMYRLRKETKSEPHRLFYKLLMNNLYGQLGMSGEITKTFPLDDVRHGGKVYGQKQLCDVALPLAQHVNYMHAAYITSYGRLELFKYLKKFGERMIYCDTDSVFFTGRNDVECGKELGQMKFEGQSNYCKTYCPKTYVFDDEYKAKGVPREKAKEYIRKKVVTYWTPYKLREAISFFDRKNARKLSVWRPVEKALLSTYDKKLLKGEKYFPKKACDLELEC